MIGLSMSRLPSCSDCRVSEWWQSLHRERCRRSSEQVGEHQECLLEGENQLGHNQHEAAFVALGHRLCCWSSIVERDCINFALRTCPCSVNDSVKCSSLSTWLPSCCCIDAESGGSIGFLHTGA